MSEITIGLVGNPNSGKTTLFNALTGAKQRVGNWPGVTVERKTGDYRQGSQEIEVVDLPGIYSLAASSLDEKISRDYVISREPDLIVNIVDASNLERNLYLTVQLLEMKVPMVVALNMMDIVKQRHIKIKIESLEELLGCPVVPITANKDKGIDDLKITISKATTAKEVSSAIVEYPGDMEKAIAGLITVVEEDAVREKIDPRWLAVKLLEDDEMAVSIVGTKVGSVLAEARKRVEANLGDEADILVADG